MAVDRYMMPKIALEITRLRLTSLHIYKRLLKLIIGLLGATDVSYIINVGECGARLMEESSKLFELFFLIKIKIISRTI
jgi:hypothetical protein